MDINDLHPRRTFLATGAAALALGAVKTTFADTTPTIAPPSSLDVRQFGAAGDGKTDDTRAFQKALDQAAASQGTVFVPAGVYICSTLKIPPHVGLMGTPTWTFRDNGGSILRLRDADATCLIDITNAVGATLHGLCLDGRKLGKNCHGVWLNKPDFGKQEDAFRIERCRVDSFSGDGVRLDRAWAFSIRHNMISFNGGNGIRLHGWDGFVLDNWISANTLAGFGAYDLNASVTMTANRIEWNAGGGILVHGAHQYNITGNYIDRSGGPAISLLDLNGYACEFITVTGNVIYRSGKPEWRKLADLEDCHIRMQKVRGAVVTSNCLCAGRDDNNQGSWSPHTAIILEKLTNCIVKDNVLHEAALTQLIKDLGSHAGETIIKDNPGSLKVPN